jgi:hypothetical protein
VTSSWAAAVPLTSPLYDNSSREAILHSGSLRSKRATHVYRQQHPGASSFGSRLAPLDMRCRRMNPERARRVAQLASERCETMP